MFDGNFNFMYIKGMSDECAEKLVDLKFYKLIKKDDKYGCLFQLHDGKLENLGETFSNIYYASHELKYGSELYEFDAKFKKENNDVYMYLVVTDSSNKNIKN